MQMPPPSKRRHRQVWVRLSDIPYELRLEAAEMLTSGAHPYKGEEALLIRVAAEHPRDEYGDWIEIEDAERVLGRSLVASLQSVPLEQAVA